MAKYVVASVDEIPAGCRKLVEVRGRKIAIFNLSGQFYALLDRCPHLGGSLCAGAMSGLIEGGGEVGEFRLSRKNEFVRCPWHGWEFDVRTGRSYSHPERLRAKQFPVSLEPGDRVVEGPYVAETFPVSVENEYIVIES
jgi:nitrite reductase/ring-hydroxylating ferredoxin subunit